MNKILDLISEAYEYVNEVRKYGNLDENDDKMIEDALVILAEVVKEIEND